MKHEAEVFIISLQIFEAVRAYSKDEYIVITATLGGNKLETEVVKASQHTIFNNNLVWETDKESIKRMKMDNLPIKVECFSAEIVKKEKLRTLIGYVFLPIRGVPIISQNKAISISPHWYKLIGLNSEYREQKPEIKLLLTITNKTNLDQDTGTVNLKSHRSENIECIPFEAVDTRKMLSSQKGVFVKLLQEEGLLQIGALETECDIFIVKITFEHAKNIEQILNSQEQAHPSFHLSYNLLGTPMRCPLIARGKNLYTIEEKIAIHFRTSLNSLGEYFKDIFYIPMDLYCNDMVLGHAKLTFENILPAKDLKEFLNLCLDNENTFEAEGSISFETFCDLPKKTSQPFVEYQFSIKYLSRTKMVDYVTNIDELQPAESVRDQFEISLERNVPQETEQAPMTVRTLENESNNSHCDSALKSAKDIKSTNEMAFPPKHSKPAITTREFSENKNAVLEKQISDRSEEARRTRPRIENENEISNPPSDSILITAKSTETNNEVTTLKSSKSEPIIRENSKNEDAVLQKDIVNGRGKQYVDERIIYKIVEELEEWKEKQQEIFLVELKRKEIHHLASLMTEWRRRKKEQEIKLDEKLEQCTALKNLLDEAYQAFKTKGIQQLERERITAQIRAEVEQTFNFKLLEVKEDARRAEDDLSHKLRLEEIRYRELELSKAAIERDRQKLRVEKNELEAKITEMRQTFLPREQLSGLFQDLRFLNERLDEVQKSKIFYKEQWEKAIREVHRIKNENLLHLELQLKHNRNEIEGLLTYEQSELLSERTELNLIKEALKFEEDCRGCR